MFKLRARVGRPSASMVVALLALVLAASGVAVAAIPNSDTAVIDGCYENRTGVLRVIDAESGKTCTKWEMPISWNQQGVPGPQGSPGPQGTPGPQGSPGDLSALEAEVAALDARLDTVEFHTNSLQAQLDEIVWVPDAIEDLENAVRVLYNNVDVDDDGFTVLDGDCDDLDATAYPGATEIPGNFKDEDCDHQAGD